MSVTATIDNRTPFDVKTHIRLDADGQEVMVVMLSASFVDPEGDGRLQPATEGLPVTFGDVPFGEPGRSSTRYESDIAPVKPGAEIIVNGSAHAPNGEPVEEMRVGLQVGGLTKVLTVTGDRLYDAGAFSRPHPFSTLPIVWERAYGGTTADGGAMEWRNPLGIGHRGARSADPGVLTEAPNITLAGERYDRPSDRVTPASFGCVGRGWQPRIALAGTYDQAWLDEQWPLPPHDYDPAHDFAAPADQRLPQLSGETVTLVGLTPDGRWRFRVPTITAPLRLLHADRTDVVGFSPDTLIVEPDLRRVTLKARHAFRLRRNAPPLRELIVGHVTGVYLISRRKQKLYLNPRGGDGTVAGEPVWLP